MSTEQEQKPRWVSEPSSLLPDHLSSLIRSHSVKQPFLQESLSCWDARGVEQELSDCLPSSYACKPKGMCP